MHVVRIHKKIAYYIVFEQGNHYHNYIYITMLQGFSTLDTCYQNNQCPLNSLDDENIVGQPCLLNECNSLLYTIYAYGISTSRMKTPYIPSIPASRKGNNLPPPKSIDLLIAQASNQCSHILRVSVTCSRDDSTSWVPTKGLQK